jgi:hypothetical protein
MVGSVSSGSVSAGKVFLLQCVHKKQQLMLEDARARAAGRRQAEARVQQGLGSVITLTRQSSHTRSSCRLAREGERHEATGLMAASQAQFSCQRVLKTPHACHRVLVHNADSAGSTHAGAPQPA